MRGEGCAGWSTPPGGVVGVPAAGEQDGKASEGGEEGSTAVGSSLGGLQVFEFNGKTAPVQRHKRIKDFQGGGDDGAKVSGCRSNRGPICGART